MAQSLGAKPRAHTGDTVPDGVGVVLRLPVAEGVLGDSDTEDVVEGDRDVEGEVDAGGDCDGVLLALRLRLVDEVPVPLTEPLVLMVPDTELDRLVVGVVPGVWDLVGEGDMPSHRAPYKG